MSQPKITPTFFKLTSDVGFKKLFGSSGNEALLIQLLNSIIDDKVIAEVEMQNVGSDRHQFPDRALAYSALSILDQWHVKQQYKSDK